MAVIVYSRNLLVEVCKLRRRDGATVACVGVAHGIAHGERMDDAAAAFASLYADLPLASGYELSVAATAGAERVTDGRHKVVEKSHVMRRSTSPMATSGALR